MFRLILTVLLGLALTAPAHTEENNDQEYPFVELPMLVQCGSYELIDKVFEDFKELQLAESVSNFKIPDGRMITAPMEIYVNPKTRTFSVVVVLDTVKCIAFSGHSFTPTLNSLPINNGITKKDDILL